MGSHEKLMKQRAYVKSLERMGAGRVSDRIKSGARKELYDLEAEAASRRRMPRTGELTGETEEEFWRRRKKEWAEIKK